MIFETDLKKFKKLNDNNGFNMLMYCHRVCKISTDLMGWRGTLERLCYFVTAGATRPTLCRDVSSKSCPGLGAILYTGGGFTDIDKLQPELQGCVGDIRPGILFLDICLMSK